MAEPIKPLLDVVAGYDNNQKAAFRAALNLGTAATTSSNIYASAAQGAAADTAVQSNASGITGATVITNMIAISQADYDDIISPNANTLYAITDAV